MLNEKDKKSLRPNRLTGTPAKTQFVSTYRVESDQKEIILAKLKSQAQSLRKNEVEFTLLKEQYSDLDRRYRAQLQQKTTQDQQFKNKHEGALRHISQLKNQLDAMKAELRDKKLEIQDLRTDQQNLKNSIDQRNVQIQKLRSEINAQLCDSDQLQNQRIAFIDQLELLRKNNFNLNESLFNLQKQNQACNNKLGEMQKYLDQLETESRILTGKIKDYEDSNNEIDHQIQSLMNQISQMDNMIVQCQQDCVNLQKANASISSSADQFKSQAIHNQKATQAQTMKNNDLVKKLRQAQNALKVRIGQVQEGHGQINNLKDENQHLQKINSQLLQDLESCRRHLQNLGLLNHQLIGSLENFSQEDRRVSELVNRGERVKYLNGRIQETSSIEFYNGKESARTDVSFNSSRRKFRL